MQMSEAYHSQSVKMLLRDVDLLPSPPSGDFLCESSYPNVRLVEGLPTRFASVLEIGLGKPFIAWSNPLDQMIPL